MVDLDIPPEDFKENGTKLKISRMYISRYEKQGQWGVENEQGVLFRNPKDTEPAFSPPIKAALNTESEIEEKGSAKNVTIKTDFSVDDEYFLKPVTVYVLDKQGYLCCAMDENGDYGVGGTFTEAVYNLQAVIDMMD